MSLCSGAQRVPGRWQVPVNTGCSDDFGGHFLRIILKALPVGGALSSSTRLEVSEGWEPVLFLAVPLNTELLAGPVTGTQDGLGGGLWAE